MRNATEIEPTDRTILACECGELLILLGSRDDWRSEEHASFKCGACGSELSFPLTLPEGDGDAGELQEPDRRSLSIGELVKELKAARSG